ncbi:MAG: hypothetical protein BJ554DRAFT_6654 [Olpidium bornovanus]|uniref:Aldehyde dehydrogenase domain-containing protein n=1 Tax=Olpidium bornovanus TaxID=278681 RepID=A0A8H7ZXL7_9FUNG|nr:MAG: hypothetical protein BJ554DRAFT_6654 [Olpidium bornovanus]
MPLVQAAASSARARVLVTNGRHAAATSRRLFRTARPARQEMTMYATRNFIGGKFAESKASEWIDLHNPVVSERAAVGRCFPLSEAKIATNELVTRVPQTTPEELAAASRAASAAFVEWRKTSILSRQRKMLDLQLAIRENMVALQRARRSRIKDRIAESITLEQGKTFADAKGDVLRGTAVCIDPTAVDFFFDAEFDWRSRFTWLTFDSPGHVRTP